MSTTAHDQAQIRTALDALRESEIVVASDGAEYHRIADFSPTDATSNPSLIYATLCKPEYTHHLEEGVRRAVQEEEERGDEAPGGVDMEKAVERAMDWLLVLLGAEILARIPGRVSLSLDPRLFLPFTVDDDETYERVLARCLSLHALASTYLASLVNSSSSLGSPSTTSTFSPSTTSPDLSAPRPPPPPRILLKLPATPLGLRIASTLASSHGIESNMTLVFGLVQARACAQAGVRVISPFVGRVKDWWDAQHADVLGQVVLGSKSNSLADHPGIHLVRSIKALYKAEGYEGTTQIMAAGIRAADEVLELVRTRKEKGPDYVTLPPELLAELRALPCSPSLSASASTEPELTSPLPPSSSPPNSPIYFTRTGPTPHSLQLFQADLAKERIALDKVPEGLAKFGADTVRLEGVVRGAVLAHRVRVKSEEENEGERKEHGKQAGAKASAGAGAASAVQVQMCTRGKSVQVD